MEKICKPILGLIFRRLAVSNTTLPKRNRFGDTYDNNSNPSHQNEHKKGSRLNEGVELVGGIMDGVKVIVDTVELAVHV
jgi:hypothetical protein